MGKSIVGTIVVVAAVAALFVVAGASFAQDIVRLSDDGLVTSLSVDESIRQDPDYLRAQPMPLPRLSRGDAEFYLEQQDERTVDEGPPRSTPGFRGTGETWPGLAQRLYSRREWRSLRSEGGVENQAHGGRGRRPYTTSLVDLFDNNVSATYPYRAAGKLFFDASGRSASCSGALVGKGILVTAAHCVVDHETDRFYENFSFVPAFLDGDAPYGAWRGEHVSVATRYLDRFEDCLFGGLPCESDIAIVVLEKKNGRFPGQIVGFFARGWNGFGSTKTEDPPEILITQLGYPVSHNGGQKMIRTDAQGEMRALGFGLDISWRNNTRWGSSQTGGSSGGPGVANFGRRTDGKNGRESLMNRVVQVTSWGYANSAFKVQGASRFTTRTLVPLVRDACAHPSRPC